MLLIAFSRGRRCYRRPPNTRCNKPRLRFFAFTLVLLAAFEVGRVIVGRGGTGRATGADEVGVAAGVLGGA